MVTKFKCDIHAAHPHSDRVADTVLQSQEPLHKEGTDGLYQKVGLDMDISTKMVYQTKASEDALHTMKPGDGQALQHL